VSSLGRVPDADRIARAIARLDAPSRALLELSARRGLSDDEIADVLAVEPAEVARRREEALERLGAEADLSPEERDGVAGTLADLDDAQWRGETGATPTQAAAAAPTQAAAAAPSGPGGRRRWPVVLALAAVAAIAAVVIVLAVGGDDADEPSDKPATSSVTTEPPATEAAPPTDTAATTETAPETAAPGEEAGPVVTMDRLNNTRGSGTAQIIRQGEGAILRLNVSGFARPQGGGYAVWLYSSAAESVRLFATAERQIVRDIPISDFETYRYVEVVRAIPRLTSARGDLPLLRAPVSALSG
jgi:hypothetical protein